MAEPIKLEQITATYQSMLADATRQFEETVQKANAEMQRLVQQANTLPNSTEEGLSQAEPKEEPKVAWVDGNLVLNRATIDTFQSLFSMIQEVLNEILERSSVAQRRVRRK